MYFHVKYFVATLLLFVFILDYGTTPVSAVKSHSRIYRDRSGQVVKNADSQAAQSSNALAPGQKKGKGSSPAAPALHASATRTADVHGLGSWPKLLPVSVKLGQSGSPNQRPSSSIIHRGKGAASRPAAQAALLKNGAAAPASLAEFATELEALRPKPKIICPCAPLVKLESISQYANRERGAFEIASIASATRCPEAISCKVPLEFSPQFLFAFNNTVMNNGIPAIGHSGALLLQDIECSDSGKWKLKDGDEFDSFICFYDSKSSTSIPIEAETPSDASEELEEEEISKEEENEEVKVEIKEKVVAAGVLTAVSEEDPLKLPSSASTDCPCPQLVSLDQSANLNSALISGSAVVSLSVVSKCETKATIACTIAGDLTPMLRFRFNESRASAYLVRGGGKEVVEDVTCNPITGQWQRGTLDPSAFVEYACFAKEDEEDHDSSENDSDVNQASSSAPSTTANELIDQGIADLNESSRTTAAPETKACPCSPVASLELITDSWEPHGTVRTFNNTESGCENLAIITCSVAPGFSPRLSFRSNGIQAGDDNVGHAYQSALEPVNCNAFTGQWQRTIQINRPFDKFTCLSAQEQDCLCGSFARLASSPKESGHVAGIYSISPLSASEGCSAPMILSCTAPAGFIPRLLLTRNGPNAEQKVIQAQTEGEASEKFSCLDGVWSSKSFGTVDSFTCFYVCPCAPMSSLNKPGSDEEMVRGGEVDVVATAAFGCEKEAMVRCSVADGHLPVLSYRLQGAKAGENTVGFLRDVEDYATCDSVSGTWKRTYDNSNAFSEFSCFAQRTANAAVTSVVSSISSSVDSSTNFQQKESPSACLSDQSDVTYTLKKVIQFPEGDKTVTLYEIGVKNNGDIDICGGNLVYYIHLKQDQVIREGYNLIEDGSFEVFPPRLVKNEGQYRTPNFFTIGAGKAYEGKIGLYVYGTSSDPPVICTVSLTAKNC